MSGKKGSACQLFKQRISRPSATRQISLPLPRHRRSRKRPGDDTVRASQDNKGSFKPFKLARHVQLKPVDLAIWDSASDGVSGDTLWPAMPSSSLSYSLRLCSKESGFADVSTKHRLHDCGISIARLLQRGNRAGHIPHQGCHLKAEHNNAFIHRLCWEMCHTLLPFASERCTKAFAPDPVQSAFASLIYWPPSLTRAAAYSSCQVAKEAHSVPHQQQLPTCWQTD